MYFGLGSSIWFFLKAMFFGIATLVTIPKEVYKKYFIWGFLFGGIGDVIMVVIFNPILNLIKYKNMGVFNAYGIISFWTPIAWMFTFMLFFYFLPVHRLFLYLYILGFAIFGHILGMLLQNLGLFEFVGSYVYIAPITFVFWFSFATLIYFRYNRIILK
jgi:hypothetical protein